VKRTANPSTLCQLTPSISGHYAIALTFELKSRGVETNRDPWVYNFSNTALESNMTLMIDNYNHEVTKYVTDCSGKPKQRWSRIEDIVDATPSKISWSRALKKLAAQGRKFQFEPSSVITSLYRPFSKQRLYFNRQFNEYVNQWPHVFPTSTHENVVIVTSGIGASKSFSALITDCIPNLHMHDTGQCFPLYTYEERERDYQEELFTNNSRVIEGFVRHYNVKDQILDTFRTNYHDVSISKEDIFYYVYGVLHSIEYKQRFGADLKKLMARIPFAQDFWTFSNAGRELAKWHLNYENVEPYPVKEYSGLNLNPQNHYRVTKMNFDKKNGKVDKSTIIYNQHIKISDIPLEAYDYIVNGKSALEWIMERYQVTTDRNSQILNDPNEWSDDPKYILNLVKRIITVSVETMKIVNSLPPLNEKTESMNVPT